MLAELILMWTAVVLYALSAAGLIFSVVFGSVRARSFGLGAATIGLAVHAIGIVVRWVRVGHGPYLGFYEVASLLAFMGVALFLGLVWKYRAFSVAGAVLMPVSFGVLGVAMLASKEAEAVSGSLASAWLGIHVLFANLAYGSYAAAFVLSIAFLMRDGSTTHPERRLSALLERFPAQEIVDDLTFKFVGAGFVFQGIMIASGAVWANEAWGRYWGWDPMETWSLIAWAIYAIYLHLRLTMGWHGRKAAWVAVISLPVIVFSLLGVPLAYRSIHGAYLKW